MRKSPNSFTHKQAEEQKQIKNISIKHQFLRGLETIYFHTPKSRSVLCCSQDAN